MSDESADQDVKRELAQRLDGKRFALVYVETSDAGDELVILGSDAQDEQNALLLEAAVTQYREGHFDKVD
jgi:predicted RNA-binding protein with PIN domain